MAEPLISGDPRQIGEYWLAGRLGSGGQGVVYEAYAADGTRVAIKALHGELVGEGKRDMLAKEVAAARRVASFCTARVLAADLDATPAYVVSEFVSGPDLQAAVAANGPFGGDELHRLAIGVATALTAIHGAGVVHRDLKPANILLGPDGPRVIDFGIARTAEGTRSAVGGLKGTPRYMAPELFQGGRASTASDVWAWGAVVLFAALGEPPFKGSDLPQLMHEIVHGAPDLSVLPDRLRSVAAAALAKDPGARPAARDVLLALVGGSDETGRLLAEGGRAAAAVRPRSWSPAPSLADAAEAVFERLDRAGQEAVPHVLLRMVLPGDGADDTLRRAGVAEFSGIPAARQVVERFASAGLLVRDGDTVAIANVALLRAWPRLRAWIDSERDGLAVHHDLADAALLWDAHGRKNSDLYQGTPLQRALQWAATGRRYLTLNDVERAFLDAGTGLGRRRTRRRALVSAALAVLLMVSLGALGAVAEQRQTVIRQRDEAIARRLALTSEHLRGTDPRTGRRLAAAAAALADNQETRRAVLSAVHQWEDDLFTPPDVSRGDTRVRLSEDGRTVLTADKGSVRFWDMKTRRRTRVISGVGEGYVDVALSRDNKTLAVLGVNGKVRLWSVDGGRPIGPEFGEKLNLIRFSRSGGLLLAGTGDGTELWDPYKGVRILRWDGVASGFDVAAGDRRAVVAIGGRVEMWDVATRRKLSAPWLPTGSEKERPRFTTFSPDGSLLAVEVGDLIKVLDVATGLERASFDRVSSDQLAFSDDGRYIATGLALYRLDQPRRTGPPVMRTDRKAGDCTDVRFGPDDRTLRCVDSLGAVTSLDVGFYTRPRLILDTGGPDGLSTFATSDQDPVTISDDGGTLAVRDGGEIRVWDVRRRNAAHWTIRYAPGRSSGDEVPMAMTPNGGLLAIPVTDVKPIRAVDVWDTRRRRKISTVRFDPIGPGGLISMAISPDGTGLALVLVHGEAMSLYYADVSGKPIRKVTGTPPGRGIPGVEFTPDGSAVVVGGGIGAYAFPSGRPLAEPHPETKTIKALSPDGRTAVTESVYGEISLWDVRTQRRLGAPLPPLGQGLKIGAAAFSPDGRYLAIGERAFPRRPGNIRLWDLSTRREISRPLTGHGDAVDELAFTPDGRRLLSVGRDLTLREHVLDPKEAVAHLCGIAGPLTKAEWRHHVVELPYQNICR